MAAAEKVKWEAICWACNRKELNGAHKMDLRRCLADLLDKGFYKYNYYNTLEKKNIRIKNSQQKNSDLHVLYLPHALANQILQEISSQLYLLQSSQAVLDLRDHFQT